MKKLCWFILASLVSLSSFSQWQPSGNNIYNTNTGFVGIGLQNPLYPVHIQSTTTGSGRNFYIQNNSGAHCFSVDNLGNVYIPSAVISNDLEFEASAAAIMRLYSGGTTAAALTFYANGGADGSNYSVVGNAHAGIALDSRAAQPPFQIQTASGGVTTNALSVFSNNNISIGTNVAVDNGNLFQVNGNLWTTGFKLPTGAAAGKVLTSDASGNATWQTATGGSGGSGWAFNGNTTGAADKFGTIDNYDLPIITNNIERMRILSGGTVAIGTSTAPAGYVLAVNGNAIFTKVKVQAIGNWADYVFEKGYNLPRLDEVERFIHHYHHLSNIPSAKEVAENGVDLADQQVALLRKVEELTLYLIDQNQQMKEQAKRLDAQQKEIDALKALIMAKSKRKAI